MHKTSTVDEEAGKQVTLGMLIRNHYGDIGMVIQPNSYDFKGSHNVHWITGCPPPLAVESIGTVFNTRIMVYRKNYLDFRAELE
jgi:hypothetical protein